MSTWFPANNRSSFVAVAICAVAYLYVFPYQPAINNPNENVRFYMTAAMVENGTYSIDAIRERWGWVNDAAKYDGRLYSVKAPGTSLLGVPAYAAVFHGSRLLGVEFDRTVALWWCRVTASIIPTLIWLFFLHLWFTRRTTQPALRDGVFFSIALGSLLYGYATMYVSHTLSAAAGFGAFMLLYDARHGERRSGQVMAALAGFLTASVTLFEYPGLVASLMLAIYGCIALRPLRLLAGFTAGGIVPTLAMMHFQWRAFGSPFTPGHLYVENPWLRADHHQGIYGAVGPSWEAFYGLILDPASGLLPLTPVLAVAPIGFLLIFLDRKRRLDAAIAISLTVFTVLAICSMNNWRGGWTIGPRYLAVLFPFLAWGALEGLDRAARKYPLAAGSFTLGSAIAAVVASGSVSAYYPHLPPELTRPLPQLLGVLLRHDFAPFNAGSFFGLHGTVSMIPLFATALWVPIWLLRSTGDGSRKSKVCAAGAVVAAVLISPLMVRPDREPGVKGAVAFITGKWRPTGHDLAARYREMIDSNPDVDPALLRRLADVYSREGRFAEARSVRERIDRRTRTE